jgi:hypothetical protein
MMLMVMNIVVCFLFFLSIGGCQKGKCRSGLVVEAVPLMEGLADPAEQSIFVQQAPNALDPSYIMTTRSDSPTAYTIAMGKSSRHSTGLVKNGTAVLTTIFGYSDENDINGGGQYIWPGKTIVQNVMSAGGADRIDVEWINNLYTNHTLPVDTSVHWCFSMEGYKNYTIAKYGVPTVPHLHGGQHETRFVSIVCSSMLAC